MTTSSLSIFQFMPVDMSHNPMSHCRRIFFFYSYQRIFHYTTISCVINKNIKFLLAVCGGISKPLV